MESPTTGSTAEPNIVQNHHLPNTVTKLIKGQKDWTIIDLNTFFIDLLMHCFFIAPFYQEVLSLLNIICVCIYMWVCVYLSMCTHTHTHHTNTLQQVLQS